MEYIKRRNNYFMTEAGDPWTPIGFNESFTWESMKNDPEPYFIKLNQYKINCLRMIFEYAETSDGLLETQQGVFNQTVVSKWKNIFDLCRRYDIRLLMSPYDTFWQWQNWKDHPYNTVNSGYLKHPSTMLSDPQTLQVHKHRLKFLIESFSQDGTIFAWDLWNEIHPAYNSETSNDISSYIEQMGSFIRETEENLFGKSHLQTCSIFLPALIKYNNLNLIQPIFQHKSLDFSNVHLYDDLTISNPKNVTEPAVKVGAFVKDCLDQIKDGRPFFDSESGPIQLFETGKQLEESFDEQYFSNMCWAHLASGGVGAGFRWPYRRPHCLTDGMLSTLQSVSNFCSLIDWNKFNRQCLNSVVLYNSQRSTKVFCCGTGSKFILFVMRTDLLDGKGLFKEEKRPSFVDVRISIPDVSPGTYKLSQWSDDGKPSGIFTQNSEQIKGKSNLTLVASVNHGLILRIDKI